MWPFKKKYAPFEDADQLACVRRMHDELNEQYAELRVQLMRSEEKLSASVAEAAKLKKQVREQTDADLYLVSAKIMRDILEKGKPVPADVSRQQSLAALQAQAYNQSQSSAFGQYSGPAFGGLGMSIYGL